MQTLLSHFILILAGLKSVVAQLAIQDRALTPRCLLLNFAWGRINRAGQRFQRLYLRWKNGTLPKPRAARPGRTGEPRPAVPRLPGQRGWLVHQNGYTVAAYASQLRHFIATTPELAEFLAAAPQAGRILRPLCHMLGVNLDAPLGIPLAPAPPSAPPGTQVSAPANPAPPAPPASHASGAAAVGTVRPAPRRPPKVFSPA